MVSLLCQYGIFMGMKCRQSAPSAYDRCGNLNIEDNSIMNQPKRLFLGPDSTVVRIPRALHAEVQRMKERYAKETNLRPVRRFLSEHKR
jgi:hypothetical protein